MDLKKMEVPFNKDYFVKDAKDISDGKSLKETCDCPEIDKLLVGKTKFKYLKGSPDIVRVKCPLINKTRIGGMLCFFCGTSDNYCSLLGPRRLNLDGMEVWLVGFDLEVEN